mmetsp:Transcript_24081/g.67839  ORF Transcript_24081/g.67839 Transcript_24081/m.67839 type:complete len:332 (+) Transcript_24081:351-1346(+)
MARLLQECIDGVPVRLLALHPRLIVRPVWHNVESQQFRQLGGFPQSQHVRVRDELIHRTGKVKDGTLQVRDDRFRIPTNSKHQSFERCHEWHQVVHHLGNAQERVFDNHTSQRQRILFCVLGEVECNGPAQGSTEDEYLGWVDFGMLCDVAQGSFGIQLQTRLVRRHRIAVAVPAVLDHEHVGIQELEHVDGIWKAQADISSVSVEEDQRRNVLFGLRTQEEPCVDLHAILAKDLLFAVRDLMFRRVAVAARVLSRPSWQPSDFGKVEQRILLKVQDRRDHRAQTHDDGAHPPSKDRRGIDHPRQRASALFNGAAHLALSMMMMMEMRGIQ